MFHSALQVIPVDVPLVEPSGVDLIRAHLRNARNLAAEHGYFHLVPCLDDARFDLEEFELIAAPARV